MSSINYKKMAKTARAGIAAIIAHNSTDTRLQKDHSTKDIDKSRTADNWQLYKMGYRDTYDKFLSRIKEIDSVLDENGKQVCNQRSNRIEAIYLEIPYPPEYKTLTQEQQDAWRDGVVNYLRHEFGNKNVIQAWVHVDEVHTYKDKFSGELVESRPHIHALVVPESKSKQNHLDAKTLTLKKNMQKRNRAIDTYTKKEYGINFMTGERAHKMKVEDLKRMQDADTQIRELTERATEAERAATKTEAEAQKRIDAARREMLQNEIDAEQKRISVFRELKKLEEKGAEYLRKLAAKQKTKQGQLDSATKELEKTQAELEKIEILKREKTIEYNNLILRGRAKADEYNDLAIKYDDLVIKYDHLAIENDELQKINKELINKINKAQQQAEDLGIRFDWERLLNKTEPDHMNYDRGEYGDED